MKKICFFDLETKHLFEDIDSGYPSYSWNKKEMLRPEITKKLGLAYGCVLSNNEDKFDFEEGSEKALLETLNKFDVVVGHNVIGFDYLVLAPFDERNLLNQISRKTVDTFLKIKEKTGQFAALNDLGKLNLGLKKTEDSKQIPKMWAAGDKQRVRDYCHNDVKLVKQLYELVASKKPLKYYVKNYGEILGTGSLVNLW